MCTKTEVGDIVGEKLKPVELSIIRIEKRLDKMPCQTLLEKTIRLEVQAEGLEKQRVADKKDIDILYRMSRTAESEIATLKEQNKGQDNISAKMWLFIMSGINLVFMIAMYFLTRGS